MKIKKLLESIERESRQPEINKTKKAFFEAVRQFSSTSNEVYSSRKLRELAKKIDSISEMAERITLAETDGWFDQVSVKRDMKAIKEASKIFAQTCNEISTLQQRLESAYEDVGTKLSKYYDLSEAMDPVGQEDGDIDNDGDEDETDEYLANRRKAISKAIKNESINEAKWKVLGSIGNFQTFPDGKGGEEIILILGKGGDQKEHPIKLKKSDTKDKLKKRFYQGREINIKA